jgi:dTDP-4-amino-4,6-dideoxygalactose transaminase
MREAPISELQACVALVQWQSRHALVERQRRNASILKNVIENCDAFTSLSTREEESPVHFFPVLIRVAPANSRAAVHRARLHLYSNGVQTESPYPLPLGSPGTLPNSNDLSERMFLVPCNASLESEQMDRISSALKEASRVVAREFNVASEAELIR